MSDVVIASAARTPIGAFLGGLGSVPASYLGQVAIEVLAIDPIDHRPATAMGGHVAVDLEGSRA